MGLAGDANSQEAAGQDPEIEVDEVVCSTQVRGEDQSGSDDRSARTLVVNSFIFSAIALRDSATADASLVMPGYTGLVNDGNLCFANSVLQIMINTREVKIYFTRDYHLQDIDRDEFASQKGQLVATFSEFVKEMWCSKKLMRGNNVVELLGSDVTTFSDGSQHDAQEFLSFLLDGLHEALKRRQKPIKGEPAYTGGVDSESSAQHIWDRYSQANASIILDTFHGLLCSRLVCTFCGKASATFEPFTFVAVPLPKEHQVDRIYYWPAKVDEPPVVYRPARFFSFGACYADLLESVAEAFHVSPTALVAVRVVRNCITTYYKNTDRLFLGPQDGCIFIFERLESGGDADSIVNLVVTQPMPPVTLSQEPSSMCANCLGWVNRGSEVSIPECRTVYCSERCRTEDEEKHPEECVLCSSPCIAPPFSLSMRRSECTFRNLRRMLEYRSSFSVQVFKSPTVPDCIAEMQSDEVHHADEVHRAPGTIMFPGPEGEVLEEGASNGETVFEDQNGLKSPKVTQLSCSAQGENGTGKAIETIDFRNGEQSNGSPCFYISIAGSSKFVYEEDMEEGGDRLVPVKSDDHIALHWRLSPNGSPYILVKGKKPIEASDALSQETPYSMVTLAELLRCFTDTEVLTGGDSWHCSRCCKRRTATKALSFWKLPPVLIIQIKRFTCISGFMKQKIEVPVRYPLKDFDMKPFLSADAPEQVTKYDLYAVVSHSGCCNYGHYVAQARLQEENGSATKIGWRLFNDSIVSDIASVSDHDSKAYFLFYSRQNFCANRFFKSYMDQSAETASSQEPDSEDQVSKSSVDDIPR